MNFLLDPNIAYFLLVIGFSLSILALFSPGTGFIEAGALFTLVLAGYGIANLQINYWALGILVLGVFPFLLALRRSRRVIFLLLALLMLTLGSVFLFRPEEGLVAVNPFLALGLSALVFGFLWVVIRKGLDAITRQPTHSLERLIGEIGNAETDVFKEGTVRVGGEEWTARSQIRIVAGSPVRVIAREGLSLFVEPVEPAQESE